MPILIGDNGVPRWIEWGNLDRHPELRAQLPIGHQELFDARQRALQEGGDPDDVMAEEAINQRRVLEEQAEQLAPPVPAEDWRDPFEQPAPPAPVAAPNDAGLFPAAALRLRDIIPPEDWARRVVLGRAGRAEPRRMDIDIGELNVGEEPAEMNVPRKYGTPFQKMSWTIGDIFGKKAFNTNDELVHIGMEFENETEDRFELPRLTGWRVHNEGSLRKHGFEYVLTNPLPFEDVRKQNKLLFSAIDKNKGALKLTNSIRTSTHVHFDMGAYTLPKLVSFVALYWILEDILTDYCGLSRKGNLFCLRLRDAEYTQQNLIDSFQSKQPSNIALASNDMRYSSVNFASLSKFGSLEFRLMSGVDNALDANRWLSALEKIRRFALKYPNPRSLKKAFLHEFEADDFPIAVFGEKLWDILYPKIAKNKTRAGIRDSLRDSFLQVSNLITCVPDWTFKKQIEEEEKAFSDVLAKRAVAKKKLEEAQLDPRDWDRAFRVVDFVAPEGDF